MPYTNVDLRLYTKQQSGYYELRAESIAHTTNRTGSAGKLEIELFKTPELAFYEGDMVTLYIDYLPIFKGYVFKKKKNEKGKLTVTCYDQLRYLKAKQSYIISGMTATDVLRRAASDFRLELGDIADAGYVLAPYVEEDKEVFEILTTALNKTFIATNKMFVVYDCFGRLTLKAVKDMAAEYIEDDGTRYLCAIGDKSFVTGYDYTTSIDDETYNYIKIVRPNESTGGADTYVYNDEDSIGRWGLLQLYHKADKDMNEAQVMELGHTMLEHHNRVRSTFKVECLGILGVIAGNTIAVDIADVGEAERLVIDKCTHTFKSGGHTMSLELITG